MGRRNFLAWERWRLAGASEAQNRNSPAGPQRSHEGQRLYFTDFWSRNCSVVQVRVECAGRLRCRGRAASGCPETGNLFRRERRRRLEFVSGHVIQQGAAQLLQFRTAAFVVQIDGRNQQPARPDVALENHAKPPVAVPVVNRRHDGPQRRGAFARFTERTLLTSSVHCQSQFASVGNSASAG